MPFWPFKPKEPEALEPGEVRDRLVTAAAAGSRPRLRELCQRYKGQVNANLEFMRHMPEAIRSDPAASDQFVKCLIAVAQCLAADCAAPELWNTLHGTSADNPFLKCQEWYEQLPERTERLEHAALIAEARSFIENLKSFRGSLAQQHAAVLHGHLGNLLFNSGHVEECLEPLKQAIALCRQTDDREGQEVYLTSLVEVFRYLNQIDQATRAGEELLGLSHIAGAKRERLTRQMERIRKGEPLCQVVVVRDAEEREFDEVAQVADGRYEFQFRRNRPPLQMAALLVRQGNELASSGQLADAMERYEQASEVDPYDPDPVYQSGMCLLELGAYQKAVETFDEVERLAPGWFHGRTDRWLAQSLEEGSVTDEEFRMLRMLEDAGLAGEQALEIARGAVEAYPDFAPLDLVRGDLEHRAGNSPEAIACYRKGLELGVEPDLESRLLAALIGILPPGSEERETLLRRPLPPNGNLVAEATVALIRAASRSASR